MKRVYERFNGWEGEPYDFFVATCLPIRVPGQVWLDYEQVHIAHFPKRNGGLPYQVSRVAFPFAHDFLGNFKTMKAAKEKVEALAIEWQAAANAGNWPLKSQERDTAPGCKRSK